MTRRPGLRRLASAAAEKLRRPKPLRTARIKGCTKTVIVVKPPDPMFREAVFILREDYLTGDEANRRQLLLQARDVARRYTESLVPPVKRRFPIVRLLVCAAALLAIIKLLGVI